MSIFSMHIPARPRTMLQRLLLCVIASVCLMTGCASRPPVSTSDVLDAMYKAASGRPSGQIRVRGESHADKDASYLTDELLAALYGADCLSWFEGQELANGTVSTPIVDQVAMYLATAKHPFEIAVFRCTDSAGTLSAAKQCRRRLNAIQQSWNGTDKEDYCRLGCVEIIDNYVILIVAADPDFLLDAARRIIS